MITFQFGNADFLGVKKNEVTQISQITNFIDDYVYLFKSITLTFSVPKGDTLGLCIELQVNFFPHTHL